jgi:hypothetical protein
VAEFPVVLQGRAREILAGPAVHEEDAVGPLFVRESEQLVLQDGSD